MSTAITSKGQVTIPKPVRTLLNLHPGDRVIFELTEQGDVRLVKEGIKASHPKSRFAALLGSAGPGMSTDEVMALTRGEDAH
jgi:antitoxin PrlF